MKKIMILAISAIFVANVSAQEQQKEFKGKQFNKAERVELDIKRLTNELMLSDEQAAKFEATYRAYADELDKLFLKNAPKKEFEPGKELTDKELDALAKQRFEGFKALADLQLKYYDIFRKNLSARQVEKIFRFQEPCSPKHFDRPFDGKPCCGKHDGKKCDKHGAKKFDKPFGPAPLPEDAPLPQQ